MIDGMNPYGPNINFNLNSVNPMFLPKTSVRQVEGEQGAKAVPMGPNSEEIFVDKEAPRIWYVKTDENANKVAVSGFVITPYVPEPEPSWKDVMARMDKLEEMIANGKPASGSDGQQRNNPGKPYNKQS